MSKKLLNQLRVTNWQEIINFVAESQDDKYEEHLRNTLPFCADAYDATKTPGSMKHFLDELKSEDKMEELGDRIVSAQPLIDIVFKTNNGNEERTVQCINSLIPLNVLLTNYGKVKLTQVRVKHNDKRLFLSSSGRRSLSSLRIVSNDVILIEDINSTVGVVGVDLTNLNIENAQGCANAASGASRRSKRKVNKKKGKGKGKK